MKCKQNYYLQIIRVFKDYWATRKGRHDIIDYARAFLIVILVTIVVSLLVGYFTL